VAPRDDGIKSTQVKKKYCLADSTILISFKSIRHI